MTMPIEGDPAPPISLPDDTGRTRTLAEQAGRWTIVYFYPADDTPGCTTEACQFRDLEEDFSTTGDADVWGISPDGAASHRAFREKFGLPFTLLSDEAHEVAEGYGAWQMKSMYGRDYLGIVRSTFLVDPDGRIARAWPKVKADGHAAEVRSALTDAQAARADDRRAGDR